MIQYRLVSLDDLKQLTLKSSTSSEKRAAMQELRAWADQNGYRVAKYPGDLDADCVIQELVMTVIPTSTSKTTK